MDDSAVFRQALETYGPQPQTMMVLEEMAELAKRLLERMEKRTDRTATDAPGQRREKVGLP